MDSEAPGFFSGPDAFETVAVYSGTRSALDRWTLDEVARRKILTAFPAQLLHLIMHSRTRIAPWIRQWHNKTVRRYVIINRCQSKRTLLIVCALCEGMLQCSVHAEWSLYIKGTDVVDVRHRSENHAASFTLAGCSTMDHFSPLESVTSTSPEPSYGTRDGADSGDHAVESGPGILV